MSVRPNPIDYDNRRLSGGPRIMGAAGGVGRVDDSLTHRGGVADAVEVDLAAAEELQGVDDRCDGLVERLHHAGGSSTPTFQSTVKIHWGT